MGRKAVCFILFILLTVSLVAKAQVEDNYQEKIVVHERLTDVIVKNKDGKFVKGLKRSDFIVTINGKQVLVKSIQENDKILPDDPRVKAYLEARNKAERDNLKLPSPPTHPRYIVLVFDRYNMGLKSARESKKNAKAMLEKMLLPYDKVTVFEYNWKIRHLAGPTSDKQKILKAIDSVSTFSNNENYVPEALEFHGSDPANAARLNLINERKLYNIRRYSEALIQISNALAFLPGRKSYLVYSEGPATPSVLRNDWAGIVSSSTADVSSGKDFAVATQAMSVTERMNANAYSENAVKGLPIYLSSTNSSFYFIRRGGLQPAWTLGVDGAFGSPDKETLLSSAFTANALDLYENRIDNLRVLAIKNGGKFYDAGVTEENLFKSLASEVGDYYTLAFSVPEQEAGKYYHLSVKPKNQEHEIVYRRGFWGAKAFKDLSESDKKLALETSMITAAGVNQLGMKMNLYLIPSLENSHAYFSSEIPVDELKVSENGQYNLEQIICVHDSSGKLRFRTHKKFSTDNDSVKARLLTYTDYIPVTPEGSRISIIVRDNNTGEITVSHRSVKTIKKGESSLSMGEPIFLTENPGVSIKSWQVEEIRDNADVKEPISCTAVRLNGHPKGGSSFLHGESVLINLQVADLPKSFDPHKTSLFVEFSFTSDDKRYILIQKDQKVQILKSANTLVYTADIPIGLLPAPAGELEVLMKGLEGDRMMITRVPFDIKNFTEAKASHYKNNSRIILDVK